MPPLICECCGHTHEACTSSPPAAADTSQPCSYCCVPHYQRRLGLEWMYPASIPRLGGLFLKMVPELEGGMTGPAAMLGQALGRLIPNFEETVMMSSCIGRLDIEPRCSYKVEVNAEGKVQIQPRDNTFTKLEITVVQEKQGDPPGCLLSHCTFCVRSTGGGARVYHTQLCARKALQELAEQVQGHVRM